MSSTDKALGHNPDIEDQTCPWCGDELEDGCCDGCDDRYAANDNQVAA